MIHREQPNSHHLEWFFDGKGFDREKAGTSFWLLTVFLYEGGDMILSRAQLAQAGKTPKHVQVGMAGRCGQELKALVVFQSRHRPVESLVLPRIQRELALLTIYELRRDR
jgi:hypothetical protein